MRLDRLLQIPHPFKISRQTIPQNFAPDWDAEVVSTWKITFWTVRAGYVQGEFSTLKQDMRPIGPKFRDRLSFWQEANIVQVLRCTSYAGVLKPY